MTPIRPVSDEHRHADYAPRSAVLSILRDAGVDETIVAQVSDVLPVPVELEPNELVAALRPYTRHKPDCKLYKNAVKYDCTCGLVEALTALTQAPRCADEREIVDDFNGDNAALKSSIAALLSFDRDGKIVPHGIGGHAHKLLSAAYRRLS